MATLEGIRDVVAIVRDLLLIVFLIGGIILAIQMMVFMATLGTTVAQFQSMLGGAPSGAGPLGAGGLGGLLGAGASGAGAPGSNATGGSAKCSVSPPMAMLGAQVKQALDAGDGNAANQALGQLEPLVASSCPEALPSLRNLRQAVRERKSAEVEKYASELYSYFSG